jgi:hypothetical protein
VSHRGHRVHRRRIPGFPGYSATEEGDVLGRRGRRLTLRFDALGYPVVTLWRDGQRFDFLEHELVARVWPLPPAPRKAGPTSPKRLERRRCAFARCTSARMATCAQCHRAFETCLSTARFCSLRCTRAYRRGPHALAGPDPRPSLSGKAPP